MDPVWIAFAGLLLTGGLSAFGFAFMMGRLAQRVESVERDVAECRSDGGKVIRLETQQEANEKTLAAHENNLAQLNRQIATIAERQLSPIKEFREP